MNVSQLGAPAAATAFANLAPDQYRSPLSKFDQINPDECHVISTCSLYFSIDPKSASPPSQKEVPLGQLTVFGRISRLV